jgi:2,4-diaminopentanoate dehydrogenase
MDQLENPMNSKSRIRVAQFGIGPIGAEIVRLLLTKPWVDLVAAVDIDAAKIGKDVSEVVGLDRPVNVRVTPELTDMVDVVCHSTRSRLRDVQGELNLLLERGFHVISTTEELSFPLDGTVRESLQQTARTANVTLLGTGVNPGFMMDKLPLTLSSVCQAVTAIEIRRVVDASQRREPLQRKVGAGMTPQEFMVAVGAGTIKHMGLRESLMLIGNGLGIDFREISEELIEPVIADREITTQYLRVKRGEVAGVHQTISGTGTIAVSLELKMYVGALDPLDEVVIHGVPGLTMQIRGGVHGDRATAAMVVNSIPRVVAARPGVLTMDDIPISFR